MGLGQNGNKTFLSVADGKIIQRVKEGTPGAIQRITTTGKTVHELKYSNVEGFLKGITTKENEYGKDWLFDIEDKGEYFTLQIMFNSRYATSLLNALANPDVDFSKPITITPWCKEVDGKKKTSIYLKNGGEDVSWYFTKDTPNGMPPLTKVMFKGKEQWDDTDIMNFLEQYVKTVINPKIESTKFSAPKPGSGLQPSKEYAAPNAPVYSAPISPQNAPDEDDLPF